MSTIDHPVSVVRPDRPAVLAALAGRLLDVLDRSVVASPGGSGAVGPAAVDQLVEIDGVLTTSVLRIARSPLFGPDAAGLPLQAALARLGTPALRTLVRNLPRFPAGTPRAAVEEACRRWTEGLARAAAARWLSNQGDHDDPAEAYLCGLVSSIVGAGGVLGGPSPGEIVARSRLGARVEAVLAAYLAEPDDPDRAARTMRLDTASARLLGVLHTAVRVANALGLSPRGVPGVQPQVASSAAPSAQPSPSKDPSGPVSAPTAPGASSTVTGPIDEPITGPIDTADPLPLDMSETQAIADEVLLPAVEEAVELELAHASGLLRLAHGSARDFVHRLADEELRRIAAWSEIAPADVVPEDLVARLALTHEALGALRSEPVVHGILEQGIQDLHGHLTFERIVHLERDPSHPSLARVREVYCSTQSAPPRGTLGIEVRAEPGSALARAADGRSGTAFRTGPGRTDEDLCALLGSPHVAVAPVHAGAKVLALLAADFPLAGRAPSDEETHVLGLAAGVLGLVLENAALSTERNTLVGLAEKDDLTQINNRRKILELLHHEVGRARRFGKPLSIALVDVDHFKSWNDLHGHSVGDMVLRTVAQLISSVSREIDSYGRYGGEEFLILLPETSAEHATIYAERLRTTIESHGTDLQATFSPNALSVSVGIAQLHPRGDDAQLLIKRADDALYAAKKHGRNRVCVDLGIPGGGPAGTVSLPPAASRGVLDEL